MIYLAREVLRLVMPLIESLAEETNSSPLLLLDLGGPGESAVELHCVRLAPFFYVLDWKPLRQKDGRRNGHISFLHHPFSFQLNIQTRKVFSVKFLEFSTPFSLFQNGLVLHAIRRKSRGSVFCVIKQVKGVVRKLQVTPVHLGFLLHTLHLPLTIYMYWDYEK